MRSEFAAAVDPVFLGAIELFDRIERGSEDTLEVEHANLLSLFERVDAVLGSSKQWQLAKYAIAVWIDEVLLTTPWTGSTWWRNQILEMELFQTRICNERFFELAKDASAFRNKDALEVFYNCVLLGFRGMYSFSSHDRNGERPLDGPKTIEHWIERTYRMLEVPSVLSLDSASFRPIQGAQPLRARHQTVWWSVATLGLVVLNVAIFQYFQSGK